MTLSSSSARSLLTGGLATVTTLALLLCAASRGPLMASPGSVLQDGARPTCESLLTPAGIASAIGRSPTGSDAVQSEPGNSRCQWAWADTGATLTVSFSDAGAIAANAAVTKCCPGASDRKSTRLNSSHVSESRMPSSA